LIRRAVVLALMLVGVLAFAPGFASTAGAQYQPGQPGIILTPSTTTPGAQVTATGFGCAKGTKVELLINGEVVATGTAALDDKGSFSVTFTAPFTPGQYAVVGRCGTIEVSSILSVVALPTTTAIVATLPITGGDSTGLAKMGLVLVAAGGLLVLAVRKRRDAA